MRGRPATTGLLKEKEHKGKLFIRNATGLVRGLTLRDITIIAMFSSFGLLYTAVDLPFLYGFFPGASVPMGLLISAIPYILLIIVYWLIGVVTPRSGADYVWVS